MVLIILFLLISLSGASWQEEITEKNLNNILDELLEETNKSNEKENPNLNDSPIIYFKSENGTRRQLGTSFESKLDSLHMKSYEDFDNIIHQIQDAERKDQDHNIPNNEKISSLGEIIVEIESSEFNVENKRRGEDLEFVSGRLIQTKPTYQVLPESNFVSYTAEIGSKILHKYPDIIIDKISGNLHKVEKGSSVGAANKISIGMKKETNEYSSRAVDAMIKLLMNEFSKKKHSRTSSNGLRDDETYDDLDTILRSGFRQDDYQKNLANEVPIAYPVVAPNKNLLFDTLSGQYRNLPRPRSAYLDPSLQMSKWVGNVGPKPLMNILSPRKLSHVRLLRKPLKNILPSIGPIYRNQQVRHFHF